MDGAIMARQQLMLRPAPSLNRRQPLLSSLSSTAGSRRFAEVAGGTTADCAVVCCCCPCTLVSLLVLTVYKIPAGLCRRALRQRRRKLLSKKNKGLPMTAEAEAYCPNMQPMTAEGAFEKQKWDEMEKAAEKLEKEMWERFCNAGFWRSPSQKEQQQPHSPGKTTFVLDFSHFENLSLQKTTAAALALNH